MNPSPALDGGSPWGPPVTPPGVVFAPAPWGTPGFKEPAAPHPTLPIAAGIGALIVLVVSLVGSKLLLEVLVEFEWPVVVYVALLALVGYGPSVLWWLFASRKWGTGARFADVGFTPKWADLGWGPLIWISAIVVQVAIGVIVLLLDIPIANNTDDISELTVDRTYTVAIVITAVVAAPLVEELVFRGLVMRSLLSKMPVVVAIVLQGALFGLAHADPVRGAGNIGLVMVLSGVGSVFGAGAYLLRRIGPTIVAHAIFNGFVMILLLTGIRDRLLEENPDLEDRFGLPAEEIAIVDQAYLAEPDGGGDPHASR